MTSVKNLRVEADPTATELGRGAFVFTDAYSVFDWGQMPDEIPKKGASLCSMGANNFERLEAEGIPTHYRGVVQGDSIVELAEVENPPTEMAIELTQVPNLPHPDGEYDYETYHTQAGDNYLVPLEIVFRNVVPVGSSLRTRTEPADHGLDLDAWPDEPIDLEEPIVEFSTKYEEQDRYLDRDDAAEVAGKADLDHLEDLAREVNRIVTDRAAEIGLTHQDGKIECLYHQGNVMVADVAGTFDENRFAWGETQVSKEVIRQYYKTIDPEWVAAVEEAKLEARVEGVPDWRTLCSVSPKPLPDHVVSTISKLYRAGANAYTELDLFEAPALEQVVETLDRI